MLSVDYLNSIQLFSEDLQEELKKSWSEFDITTSILHHRAGEVIDNDGYIYADHVQPWTQEELVNKKEKFRIVNNIGMAFCAITCISLVAAPIFVSLGVCFGLALGVACGYAVIPLGVSFIALVIAAIFVSRIAEQFQLQTIYHLQNAWANPAIFNIQSVRTFRPYFAVGTRAEQYANLLTSIQLLRNRQPENAEIYAKMLLGHQINTLQPVDPRRAMLLKFFKAKAILNRIPFIQAHRTISLNGTRLDIDAAIAAGH